MTSSFKNLGMNKNQGEEISFKSNVNEASNHCTEYFLCCMNDNVSLIASNEVPLEKLEDQSFEVIFGVIIFTNMPW